MGGVVEEDGDEVVEVGFDFSIGFDKGHFDDFSEENETVDFELVVGFYTG